MADISVTVPITTTIGDALLEGLHATVEVLQEIADELTEFNEEHADD